MIMKRRVYNGCNISFIPYHLNHAACKTARIATERQRYGALVALDVKNAFNTLKWTNILTELKRRAVPDYLLKIITDSFKERTITYDANGIEIPVEMHMGVPQGSVLGPLFWNIVYDSLLQIRMENGCSIRAFADDILITAEAATEATMKERVEKSVDNTKRWLDEAGLVLAETKTEIMLMNRKKTNYNLSFRVGLEHIGPSPTMKYLGITMDTDKNFKEHITRTTNKGIRTMAALSSLMTNLGPAKRQGRRLYFNVLESIVLYGAPVWAEAARSVHNRRLLMKTQRMGFARVASAYRTVPVETPCVTTGTVPWGILVEERQCIFHWDNLFLGRTSQMRDRPTRATTRRIREGDCREYEDGGWAMGTRNPIPDIEEFDAGREADETNEMRTRAMKRWIRTKARENSIGRWKEKWREGITGVWRRKLIPDPAAWKEKMRELGYFVT